MDITKFVVMVGSFCLVLGPYAPEALRAQTPSPTTQRQPSAGTPQTLEPVVVTGRADDLTGIAGSASEGRVGQAQFEIRPFLRPGEVLEVVPGVIVTQHSGTGKANQYFLRGFNLDHGTDFSSFVDGVPVNLPTHAHGQGYMDLNWVIPELIDYVTFRKGPYYADVGDFSSAGTAAFHLVKTLPEGFAKVGVGQDDYYRVLVAQTPKIGPGHLLYAFEANFYNGPWDHHEHVRKFNGVLKYTLTSGPSTFSLGFTAYSNNWDSTDQIPQRAVDQGLISRLGAIDPSDGGRTSRFSLYSEWSYKGNKSLTQANAYLTFYRLHLFSNFTFFLDDPVNGDQFEQSDRRVVIGGNVAQTWFSTWLGAAMDHTIGLQVRHDAIPEVALFQTLQRDRLSTARNDDVHETSVGFYYQNQTQWYPKVRTVLGLREDVFVFDVNSDTAVNSGNKTDAIFSPKLSLIFGPWANTEVYFNGGFGFHSNDARGTTITIDPKTGDPAQRVDPLVRTKGAEIGVRSTWVPGLNSTLAFWYLTLDSELLFVGDAGITEPSRASRRYGVEWTNFYKPLPWLALDFDIAYSHARFTEDDPAGNYIPGSVETVIATGATIDLPNGLFGSLRTRYFGPRPLIEDNSVRSKATTLVNLEAGYTYKNLRAQIDVLNLLNSHRHDIDYFYVSRLPGEAAAGVADVHFHPVEPRTVRVYLTYQF
jgi:TonB-dependent Receptor Plug Domain